MSEEDLRGIELLDREGRSIPAGREGYVRVIDEAAIMRSARDRDLLVSLEVRPGDFVVACSSIARVYPANAVNDTLTETLQSAYLLGDHQTPVQDLAFLTDQLAEMAVRALSPGVSDPRTAIECLHRLGGVVAQLADRAMPSGLRYDEDGRLRVVTDATRFSAIVASSFDPIRRYGATDPAVVVAVLGAIADGARPCTALDRVEILEEHANEVHSAFLSSRGADSKRDRSQVEAAFEATSGALAEVRGMCSGNHV